MKKCVMSMLALGSLVMTIPAIPAMAQDGPGGPPPPQDGRQGRGFRGDGPGGRPGGPPEGRGFGPMRDVPVVEIPVSVLSSYLKLTDEQKTKTVELLDKLQAERDKNRPQGRGPGGPPEDGNFGPPPGGPGERGRPGESDDRGPRPDGQRGPGGPGGQRGNGQFGPGRGGPQDAMKAVMDKAIKDFEVILTSGQKELLPDLSKAATAIRMAGAPLSVMAKLNITKDQAHKFAASSTVARSSANSDRPGPPSRGVRLETVLSSEQMKIVEPYLRDNREGPRDGRGPGRPGGPGGPGGPEDGGFGPPPPPDRGDRPQRRGGDGENE